MDHPVSQGPGLRVALEGCVSADIFILRCSGLMGAWTDHLKSRDMENSMTSMRQWSMLPNLKAGMGLTWLSSGAIFK